jgi:hypothetical protein
MRDGDGRIVYLDHTPADRRVQPPASGLMSPRVAQNARPCALAIRLDPAQCCSECLKAAHLFPLSHSGATRQGGAPPVPTVLRRDATRSAQCRNCLYVKWLGLHALQATPFPSLCGNRPSIPLPHNERLGDPGGSRPFLPLCITSTALGLIHNGRVAQYRGSGAVPSISTIFTTLRPPGSGEDGGRELTGTRQGSLSL